MYTGRSDFRDVPRADIVSVVSTLSPRVGAELLQHYDVLTLRDHAGVQWNVKPVAITDESFTKGGKLKSNAGKINLSRNEYKDLSPADQFRQQVASVNNYDAMLQMVRTHKKKADEMIAKYTLPQQNTLAKKDLASALQSVYRKDYISQGPGQAGSHAVGGFPAVLAEQNAPRYMYDIGLDRSLRTQTVLPDNGHLYSAFGNKDIAGSLENMRGQEGEVNQHDGAHEKLKYISREKNLTNGRIKSMETLHGLMKDAEAKGASDQELEYMLGKLMDLGGATNQINQMLQGLDNTSIIIANS